MFSLSSMHSTLASSSSIPYPDFDNLVASTWSTLEQSPPPTLREILGAYNSRGDGDRDMLLAMLNAKSAEDQRLASLAALQRTMIQLYQTPQTRSNLYNPDNSNFPSLSHSESLHDHTPSHPHHPPPRSHTLPSLRSQPSLSASLPPRKRHRHASRSPLSTRPEPSPTHDRDTHPVPATKHDLPPSPHSWSSNDSAEYSPRSRQSMAIGSLLSSRPDGEDEDNNAHRAGSSTTVD